MHFLKLLPAVCVNTLFSRSRGLLVNHVEKKCYCSSQYNLNLTISGVSLHNYVEHLKTQYQKALNETDFSNKLKTLQPVINALNERDSIVENIQNLSELLNDKDGDVRKMAEEEKTIFEDKIKSIDEALINLLLPIDEDDLCNAVVLEVNTGVGGQEAMLFASELFEMYFKFAEYKGWETQIVEYTATDLGGIRHGSALINGVEAYRYFKHEAGVHRVQRIPATEKGGRVHTSTVSVLALPQPTDIQVNINNKDLKIETKRASGAGGQHVNTTDSAVRIIHLPTGLAVECQVDRSQIKNKQIAMTKLKALLYQQQLETQIEKTETIRKNQVRSNFRNEKIRTYNFPQDRITDHRLQGCNIHNLKGFLEGGVALEDLINKLDDNFKVEALLNIVNRLNNK